MLNTKVYDVMFPDGAVQQYAANVSLNAFMKVLMMMVRDINIWMRSLVIRNLILRLASLMDLLSQRMVN